MPDTNGQLVDALGRKHTYLRISVTDRCNLRCIYCMPERGVALRPRAEILRLDEIARLASVFSKLGFNKYRLTGGEPLIRRGVVELAASIAGLPGAETLGITTNGVLLPTLAEPLKKAGVTRVNISLDSLNPDKYAKLTRRDSYHNARAGIQAALSAGFNEIRINVVLIGGLNDDELLDFVGFSSDKNLCVRFIEFMPFSGNSWHDGKFVSALEMQKRIATRYKLEKLESGEQQPLVAKEYSIDGFAGTIGFITAMSDHFCSSCNRIRLTSDGMLETCLYFPPEISLRDAIRAGETDDQLMERIRVATAAKPAGHPSPEEILGDASPHIECRSMHEIGG